MNKNSKKKLNDQIMKLGLEQIEENKKIQTEKTISLFDSVFNRFFSNIEQAERILKR